MQQLKVKPIIGRVGGKARLAPWIAKHLMQFEWSIFAEPFAGSAAVFFHLINEGVFEQIRAKNFHPRVVLNDADSRITKLFKTCRDHPELLAYTVAFTPYSRSEHKLAQTGIDGLVDEVEEARRFIIDHYQSFNGGGIDKRKAMGRTYEMWHTQENPGKLKEWDNLPARILAASPHLQGEPNPVDSLAYLNELGQRFCEPSVDVRVEMARRYLVDGWQQIGTGQGKGIWGFTKDEPEYKALPQQWQTLPQRILVAANALKKCYIENDDAVKCMERWASPHTAFFCDPPYLDKSHYYTEKFDGEDHRRLAECANNIEAACVAISYYPDPLLDELYPVENWDRYYKETVASSAGITRNSKTRTRPKRTEMLLVRKTKSKQMISFSGQLSLNLGI